MTDKVMTAKEREAEVTEKVVGLLPELRGVNVRDLIGGVIHSAVDLTNETERHFEVEGRTFDAAAAAAVMIQGALAAICESHVEGDVRHRLYRAGRVVGDLIAERWAAKIKAALEKEEEARRGAAS